MVLIDKKIALAISILVFNSSLQSFQLNSIYDVMQFHPEIAYQKVHDAIPFDYQPFPLSENLSLQPNQGLISETFVASIPNGRVLSDHGYVIVGDNVIKDFITQYENLDTFFSQYNFNTALRGAKKVVKVPGRVAVLTKTGWETFAHFMLEILGRLKTLQDSGIEYDYLYISQQQPFIKQILQLLGIDCSKILEPFGDNACIQADELIVPSFSGRRIPEDGQTDFSEYSPLSMYCSDWNINFLRNSFLPLAEQQVDSSQFCSKVFISRKDVKRRQIINEDEVFALFEKYGFKRYSLSNMSFLEQVALFAQADEIVGAHGAAFANMVFCKQGAMLCEIFQGRGSSTYCYLAQAMGMKNYYVIKTQNDLGNDLGARSTAVSVESLKNILPKILKK